MNSVLAILVFSCVLFQYGSDAVLTVDEMLDVGSLIRPTLAKFSMPDFNEEKIFIPSYENPPPGNAEEYPSTLTLENGDIQGFHKFRVDPKKVALDFESSERLNVTFHVKKLTYQFDFKFTSIISHSGHVVGELFDVKLCIPVDTTNNVITIVGPVGVEMWGPELSFTNGLPMLDKMFNDHNYFWYEYSREILQARYVDHCAAQLIKAVNEALPRVIGNTH